mgnify:CR=1 FL=1
MLQLYDEEPISIFIIETDVRIRVQFCNIKMKMKPCQFFLFHRYLSNLSKQIHSTTNSVDLLLVKDNLNVTISLNHFLQLCTAVESVMTKKFGLKEVYPN